MSGPVPVVLFTGSFLMGGIEEHVLQLGRGLVARGFPVAAICSPRDEILPLRQGLSQAGVRVHSLAERPASRLGKALGAAQRLRSLVGTLRQYPGCVLHIHSPNHLGADLPLLAGRLAGVRAVVRTEHGPPAPYTGGRARAWARLRDRWITRIVWVSEQTGRDHLAQLGRDPQKGLAIPNSVDVGRFSPRPASDEVHAEFGLDPAAPIVGTVSRLGEQRKGIAYFLEMAAAVARTWPAVRFLIVGDGALRGALEDRARTLGIGDRVVFAGHRPDVPRLLAAMRIFVMPSLYEGGPYTVLEAMAMEKPVVSTPVGLVPDVVEDRITGLLVPAGDSAALARAVRELLTDDALSARLARQGRALVAARFSTETMVGRVADLYSEVATAPASVDAGDAAPASRGLLAR